MKDKILQHIAKKKLAERKDKVAKRTPYGERMTERYITGTTGKPDLMLPQQKQGGH